MSDLPPPPPPAFKPDAAVLPRTFHPDPDEVHELEPEETPDGG